MKLEPFHDDLQSNLNSFNNPKFKAPMMFRCFDSQFVEAFRTIEPNKSSRLATRKEKAKLGDEDSVMLRWVKQLTVPNRFTFEHLSISSTTAHHF